MLSISNGLPSLPPATLQSPTNSKTLPSLPPATLPGQSQSSLGHPARESSGRPWRHTIKSRSPSPQPEVQSAVPVHAAPVRRARSPSPLQLVPPHSVQRSQSPQTQRVRIRSPQPSLQAPSRPSTPATAKLPWREQSFEDVCSTSTTSVRSFKEQKKLPPAPQLLQAVTGSNVEVGSSFQAGIAKGISQVAWNKTSNGLSAHKTKSPLFQATLAPTGVSGSGGAGAAWAFPGGPAAASEAAVRQLRREVEELRTELRQVKAALQDGDQRKEQDEHQGSAMCNGDNLQEGDCKPDTNGHAVGNRGLCENGTDFPTKLREASASDPHPLMGVEPFFSATCFPMSTMASTEDSTLFTKAAEIKPISIKLPYPVSNSSTMPSLGDSYTGATQCGNNFRAEVQTMTSVDPENLAEVLTLATIKVRTNRSTDVDRELQDKDHSREQAHDEIHVARTLQDDHCSQLQAHMHSTNDRNTRDDHEDDPRILCCPMPPVSDFASAATTAACKHVDEHPIGKGIRGSICLDDELCNSHCDDATVSLAESQPPAQSAPALPAMPMLGKTQAREVSGDAQAGMVTPGSHWHQHNGNVQDQHDRLGDFLDVETGGLKRDEAQTNGCSMPKRVDVNDELGSTQLRIDAAPKDAGKADAADQSPLLGLPPAWSHGVIEQPAGIKDMGSWTASVYTSEQQQRLGVDDRGNPRQALAQGDAQRVLASPAWGSGRPCRFPEASPSYTEDDFSPSKDSSGSYILASPSPCERSYIIAQSGDIGKNQCSGNNLFSPIGMHGESSPTLSPSSSRLMHGYVSDTPDGQESVSARGPAAVAAAVFAATSGNGRSHSEGPTQAPAARAQRLPAAPISISLATAQLMARTGTEAELDPWDSQELDSAHIGFNPKVVADPYDLHSRSHNLSASASLAASLSESQSSFQTTMPTLPPPPVPCFGLSLTTPQNVDDSKSLPRRYQPRVSRAASCNSSVSSHRRCASPADSSARTSRTQMPTGSGERRSASSHVPASKYFTAPPPRESFHVEPAPPAEPPTLPGQEQYRWLLDAPADSLRSTFSSCVGSVMVPNAHMSPSASYAGDLLPEAPLRTAGKGIVLRGSSFMSLPGAPTRIFPGPLRSSSALRSTSRARAESRPQVVSEARACADLRSTSMARSASPLKEAPIVSFSAVSLSNAGTPKWPPPPSILSRPPPT